MDVMVDVTELMVFVDTMDVMDGVACDGCDG